MTTVSSIVAIPPGVYVEGSGTNVLGIGSPGIPIGNSTLTDAAQTISAVLHQPSGSSTVVTSIQETVAYDVVITNSIPFVPAVGCSFSANTNPSFFWYQSLALPTGISVAYSNGNMTATFSGVVSGNPAAHTAYGRDDSTGFVGAGTPFTMHP